MSRISSRSFIITLFLFASAAIVVNANWGSGFGFGRTAKVATAGSNTLLMTTPLNAITSFDAAAIARHVAGISLLPTNDHKCATDVTGNGAMSSNDAATLARYVTGLGGGANTGTVAAAPCHANWPTTISVLKGDVTGQNPVLTGGVSGTVAVSLPALSGTSGTVIIPVTVGNMTGMDISSYDFQVTFDPSVITPVTTMPYGQSGTLSSTMLITPNASNPGHLMISAFQATPLSGSGTLLNLKFNIVGTTGQSTALTFEDYTDAGSLAHQGSLFNEGTPSVGITNGSFTIGSSGTPANTPTATSTATLAASFTPTATAAGTPGSVPVSVSLPNVSAAAGSVVTIPVTTGNVTALGAIAFDFQVSFDPAVIQLASPDIDRAGTMTDGWQGGTYAPASGHLIVSSFYSNVNQTLTGSGTLLYLKFNVVGSSGQSTGLTFADYTDPSNGFHPGFMYNEGDPSSTTTNGSVTVAAPGISGRVTYGNAIGAPLTRVVPNVVFCSTMGSPGVATISNSEGLYSLTGFGSGAYTIVAANGSGGTNITSFDAAKIAQHVTGTAFLTGNQLLVADVSNNGAISSFDAGQIARFVAGMSPWGIAGTWKLLPAERSYASVGGGITGEDYSALLMGEVSGNWSNSGSRPVINRNSSARNINVTAPRLVAKPATEVIVPVAIQNAAKKGIISYEFDLRYDPSVVQPHDRGAELAGTVSRALSVVTNAIEPGLLRVVVYGPTPISYDGVLLNLRFTAVGKPGSVSPLTWERIMFNEGEPRVNTTGGQVELF